MAYLEGAESQEIKQKEKERHSGACDVDITRTSKMRSALQRMQSVEGVIRSGTLLVCVEVHKKKFIHWTKTIQVKMKAFTRICTYYA